MFELFSTISQWGWKSGVIASFAGVTELPLVCYYQDNDARVERTWALKGMDDPAKISGFWIKIQSESKYFIPDKASPRVLKDLCKNTLKLRGLSQKQFVKYKVG